MTKKLSGLFQYVFFLGLGIFLLWLTLRKSDWNAILQDLSDAEYIYLLPATLMLLVSHFIRGLRWKILMEPLGYKPTTINTFLAVMIGYWANLAVPRLGEILKCTILARYEKVPADKLVGTIVAERAFDVVSLLVIFFITIFIQYDIIGDFTARTLGSFFQSGAGGLSMVKVGIAIGIVILLIAITVYILKKYREHKLISKIRTILKGIWQGLISVRYIRNKGLFFLYTALIWALYLLSTYMGFFAMRDMSQYGIKAAFSALSFGSLGMIIPSPGGIGSFQYAVQQVMVLYGITPEKGLSLGMLIWIAQTGIIIIFGTICFLLLPIINKHKNEKSRHTSGQNNELGRSN
jgi:glycosyltransferase 2 family protein